MFDTSADAVLDWTLMRSVWCLGLFAEVGSLAIVRVAAAADPSAEISAPASQNGDHLLVPGARIRVLSPALGEEFLVGSFLGVLGDTLTFKPAKSKDPMRVLLDERTTIEM